MKKFFLTFVCDVITLVCENKEDIYASRRLLKGKKTLIPFNFINHNSSVILLQIKEQLVAALINSYKSLALKNHTVSLKPY